MLKKAYTYTSTVNTFNDFLNPHPHPHPVDKVTPPEGQILEPPPISDKM